MPLEAIFGPKAPKGRGSYIQARPALGDLKERLGALLGRSRGAIERSLGPVEAQLGSLLKLFWAVLEPS
eukprot:3954672-Pyramimonas_sp.AAC.1